MEESEWKDCWTQRPMPRRNKRQNAALSKKAHCRAGSIYQDQNLKLCERRSRLEDLAKSEEDAGRVSIYTYVPLIALYILMHDEVAANALRQRLQKLGLKPVQKLFKVQAEAYLRTEQYSKADQVRKDAFNAGLCGKSFDHMWTLMDAEELCSRAGLGELCGTSTDASNLEDGNLKDGASIKVWDINEFQTRVYEPDRLPEEYDDGWANEKSGAYAMASSTQPTTIPWHTSHIVHPANAQPWVAPGHTWYQDQMANRGPVRLHDAALMNSPCWSDVGDQHAAVNRGPTRAYDVSQASHLYWAAHDGQAPLQLQWHQQQW